MKRRKTPWLSAVILIVAIGLLSLIFVNLFRHPGDLHQPIGTLVD